MIYTVSQINRLVAETLQEHPQLRQLRVEAEISGGKRYPSGHYYFSLKDEQAAVACVMFRNDYARLTFEPCNGDRVIAEARASIYERDGRFQLIVRTLKPYGIGDLHRQFEALKRELAAAGYFDSAKKLPLPVLPKQIGLVTSPAGAVIQDMIQILRRRFPGFSAQLIPVAVQGKDAARQIASAIEQFNRRGEVDVMIIARGGGSMEDLWCFNERIVADAIFQSRIPVISAVGHETDFTIADFVADLRAATPSAAAELVLPDKQNLYQHLNARRSELTRFLTQQVSHKRQNLNYLVARPVLRNPLIMIDNRRLRVDQARETLLHLAAYCLTRRRGRQSELLWQLTRASENQAIRQRHRLARLRDALRNLNPDAILERGYTYIQNDKQRIVQSVKQIKTGQEVTLYWHDGKAGAVIKEIYPR